MSALDLIVPAATAVGSSAVNFLSNRETNRANERINERNIEAAFEMARSQANFDSIQAKIARDWQEDMYNKYQSPSSQVEQLRSAGLNPALVFGDGSVGSFNSSQASSSGGSVPSSIPMQSFQIDAGAVSSIAKNLSDASKANEEARAVGIENKFRETQQILDIVDTMQRLDKDSLQHKILEDELQTRLATREARIAHQTYQTAGSKVAVEAAEQSILESKQRIASMKLADKLSLNADSREFARLQSDLREARARISNLVSQSELNRANVEKVSQEISESLARESSIRLDNNQKRQLQRIVIEEAKKAHELKMMGYEVDEELFIWDEFIDRLSGLIPAARGAKRGR